ncbi:MAG: sigma-54-dependent Fis family transcriptional regulator [Deltaproteobacteria bacterium]|nr:sigma-54-dependent Fis family transcriptional regulator [Deltaproteobacteria bacterium]
MDKKTKTVLLVDDEELIREVLSTILLSNGYEVELAKNGRQAMRKVENKFFHHIITDIDMPVMDGLTFIRNLRKRGVESIITVISAHTELDNVKEAFKLGASDFISKPFQSESEVLLTLQQAEEKAILLKDNIRLQRELAGKYIFANIVARSKIMRDIFATINKIADYKTTVLITGESGTGKELIAKAIHYNGIRRDKAMIDINCGGIPENLLESEFFGYARGAFTDAYKSKKGLFEEADGGTLFLDEIGDMPMSLQVKLLRVLQEGQIRPLGRGDSINIDVRIIAATSKNLAEEVQGKRFREDLFYRINVLAIEVPPLRRRKEDIPLLVDFFIKEYNKRLRLDIKGVDQRCLQKLLSYHWPGNIRQLENIIERSMALNDGEILDSASLPDELRQQACGGADLLSRDFPTLSVKKNRIIMERTLISKALRETGGNKTRASALLEISIPALLYKIKAYEIDTGK